MKVKRSLSVSAQCVVAFCFCFSFVLVMMTPTVSMAKFYWPMFQSAMTGSNAGGGGGLGDYDIRVPSDYSTIQAAINAANDGDVILVADGVYTGPGNRDIRFNKPVTLRSENGPSKTIIDCQGNGRGFLFKNDSGEIGRLDGFTVRNGKASYINGAGSEGGAVGGCIVIENASPIIKNSIITNCTVSGDVSAFGGGVSISGSKAAVLENCTISNNTIARAPGVGPAERVPQGGGGVIIMNNSTPTLSKCIISGNKTNGWSTGGGIYVSTGSKPTISGCTISYNESNINFPVDETLVGTAEYTVTNSGGISFRDFSGGLVENTLISHNKSQERGGFGCFESSPTVRNCIIEYNEATVDGGGGVGLYEKSDSQFIDTIIRNNKAEDVNSVNSLDAPYGAGVSVLNFTPYSSGPSFINCTIENNEAVGADSTGGGMSISKTDATIDGCIIRNNRADDRAAIAISGQSRAVVVNSLIEGNISSTFGGGISCFWGADAVITNCTVVNNSSPLTSVDSSPIVTNTIFWGNADIVPPLVLNGGAPVVTYSNVEGGTSGTGNINSDPLFAASDNFQLTAGSPCIDIGNNAALEIGTTDLAGQTRVQGGTVDMGAYEY